MSKSVLIFIIIGVLFLVFFLFKKLKFPKIGSLVLVSGGIKTGKSTFSVCLTFSQYRFRVFKVKFLNFFRKIFKLPLKEVPLIYSNIPLACSYVPLTEDLLLRKKRFVYGSVIYVCEASLVADSQLIRDMDVNERLLLFNKLIGHETKGGVLIYDTQSISDTHYSVKRCLSNYLYIHSLIKWVPFFVLARVRECMYSDDGSVVEVNSSDLEYSLRTVFIPKKTWKKFDAFCYSVLTDDLPVEDLVVDGRKLPDLKARSIVSFRKNFNLKGGDSFEKKDN